MTHRKSPEAGAYQWLRVLAELIREGSVEPECMTLNGEQIPYRVGIETLSESRERCAKIVERFAYMIFFGDVVELELRSHFCLAALGRLSLHVKTRKVAQ